MTESSPIDGGGPSRRRRVLAWTVALAAPVAVVALVAAAGFRTADEGARGAEAAHGGVGLAAEPLDLASTAPDIARHYTYARAHPLEYGQIPCFCGCETFLAHRSLYDCFVRSDGEGWDAHAAGCGVCIGESVTARRLLQAGHDVAAVRDAVIRQFGSTPATTPPRS